MEHAEQIACVWCRYELSGIAADGLCPECAAPVRDSTGDRRLLSACDRRWLRVVRTGLVMCGFALVVIAVPSIMSLISGSPFISPVLRTAFLISWYVHVAAFTTGVWFTTVSDPNGDRLGGPVFAFVARLLSVALLLLVGLRMVIAGFQLYRIEIFMTGSLGICLMVAACIVGLRTRRPALCVFAVLVAVYLAVSVCLHLWVDQALFQQYSLAFNLGSVAGTILEMLVCFASIRAVHVLSIDRASVSAAGVAIARTDEPEEVPDL